MKCALYRPLLSKYVDGEALPAERAQVDAHIGGCPECSRLLSQYQVLRTQVTALPHYQPDPRLRPRLFAALDAVDTPHAQDVPITAGGRGVVRPVRPPRAIFGRPRLFGNLASSFALALVIMAMGLIWQIGGPGAGTALASPTSTLAINPVPTDIPAIANSGLPGAQPTYPARVTATGGHQPATAPAGWWQTAEASQAVHSVRDENYGYSLQYPAGWWTSCAVPAAGLLAHRILQPWKIPAAPAVDEVTIDVLANPGTVAPETAVARWAGPEASITVLAGAMAGLGGFTTVSEGGGKRRRAIYLFDGSIVYRLSVETVLPASAIGRPPASTGETESDSAAAILQSFQPARDAATQHNGYAPLLFVHDGNLWQVDDEATPPRQLTHDGRVRGFAVAPDLDQVALLLADTATARWAQVVEVRNLAGPAGRPIWHAAEIHAVAWYGDHELLAIGVPAGGAMSLYRLPAAINGAPVPLRDLGPLPDGGASASNLRVAPDRALISFLAAGSSGPDVYSVRPDGSDLHAILPAADRHPTVTQYAWLPPATGDPAAHLVMVADGQLHQITLGSAESGPAVLNQLTSPQNTDLNDLVVAPDGQIALLAARAGTTAVYLRPTGAAAPHLMALPPGNAVLGSLGWSGNGRYLVYRQAGKAGERLLMANVATGQSRILLDPLPPTEH
ncbi:MAG TPA: anti-sigma factor [Chloroflexia bacterium]|nr:anti-sigma factor [Chloroflexia bacterium]